MAAVATDGSVREAVTAEPAAGTIAGPRAFVGAGVIVAAYLAVVTLQPFGERGMTAFGDLSLAVAALFAAVASFVIRARTRGAARRGWTLIGAGMVSWTLGQLAWSYYEVALEVESPFPSVADLGYLVTVPLVLGGMAALITARRGALRTLLDGMIISGSLLFVSWAFVLGPIIHIGGNTPLEWVVVLAYPIGDVAMASMALILLGHVHARERGAVALIGVGALGLAIGDSFFAYLVNIDAYTAGGLLDLGWFGGFILIGLGALRARAGEARGDTDLHAPLWVALPYVPLAIAVSTSVTLTLLHGWIGPFLYLLGVAVLLLVVVRQLVSVRDNLVLTRQLQHLAFHDPLTGLANRALFRDHSELAVARQSRTGEILAVVYVDLDGFKQVNDRLGHSAGDALLTAVANRLRDCVRTCDTLARLGGDEFAVLADPISRPADAEHIAQRIVEALRRPFDIDGHPAVIGGSVGIAIGRPGGANADELLRRADHAMYEAKVDGKGRYTVSPEPLADAAARGL
ncbi:GGDEF domain-containing protein [Actinoplanes sp. NPDC051475]|uniref:GGDEF domain-containing protein n=1 Tax=Actinoplanes sp. NPDC051475 TaxID=3157225 RepID=UPI00344F6227